MVKYESLHWEVYDDVSSNTCEQASSCYHFPFMFRIFPELHDDRICWVVSVSDDEVLLVDAHVGDFECADRAKQYCEKLNRSMFDAANAEVPKG